MYALITGASSGIGREIAIQLVMPEFDDNIKNIVSAIKRRKSFASDNSDANE